MKTNIYQMYYNTSTFELLDPGFLPLENPGNPRPDWREYWPIRRFFLDNVLNEDELYGFLSPLFRSKTNLSSTQVYQFIDDNPGHDFYSFSPLRQDAMCYLNTFEHGNRYHPGIVALTNEFLAQIDLQVDFTDLAMDNRSSVYCNFFVAKPVFWQKWFAINERMFEIAESGPGPLADKFNGLTDYRQKNPVDMKVFLLERIASLILTLDPSLSVVNYDLEQMPWSEVTYYPYRNEMLTLDALKRAYASTGNKAYLRNFFELRRQVFEKCDPAFPHERKDHFF